MAEFEEQPSRNPYGLTIKQHVFPRASIERFAGDDGMVSVYLLGKRKEFRASPDNPVFWVRRAWNDPSERGFQKRIEDNFQVVARRVLESGLPPDSGDFDTITKFHALWHRRQEIRESPGEDVELPGTLHDTALSIEEDAWAEKNGYITTRDGRMAARHMASIRIMALLNPRLLAEARWNLVVSGGAEFIVPDTFGDLGVVPLDPLRCLVADAESGMISDENVYEINRLALKYSKSYFFARDLAGCGCLDREEEGRISAGGWCGERP